jgi:hypothetical protein
MTDYAKEARKAVKYTAKYYGDLLKRIRKSYDADKMVDDALKGARKVHKDVGKEARKLRKKIKDY